MCRTHILFNWTRRERPTPGLILVMVSWGSVTEN